MKKQDFIKFSYTLRVDGKVYDTTDEKIAKEAGIFKENVVYKPLPIILGETNIIKGLEEELLKMDVGEKKVVKIPPEKGFGERNPDLIRIVPKNVFDENKIKPMPGNVVLLDGVPAKIISVESGRVRVDFNHELAGKELEYELEIVEKADTDEQKAQYLAEMVFGDGVKAKIDNSVVEVSLEKKHVFNREILAKKNVYLDSIKKYIGIEKARFVEEWE